MSAVTQRIKECDMWLFRELYFVLADFADDPQNTISRIGGGRISIPEDRANDLHHFRRAIVENYPHLAAGLEVIQVATEIDAILARRNRDGEGFEKWFWTNKGFLQHDDWLTIRDIARNFLIR